MNLSQFLKDLAHGTGPVPWESWLPVSLQTMSEAEWITAWESLTASERDSSAERLYSDGSVFADLFRQVAARHVASRQGDDLTKRTWLEDGADASRRTVERLQAQLAVLTSTTESLDTQQVEIVTKITEVEAALADFRARHVEDDYGRMANLQAQIAELTRQQEELTRFDQPAAELRRVQLADEVDTLRGKKTALDDTIRSLAAERAEAQAARDTIAADIEQLRSSHDAIQKEVEELTRVQAELAQQVAHDTEHQRQVAHDIKTKQREQREAIDALERDRMIVRELENSPLSQEASRLNRELDDLFQRVEADTADTKLSMPRK